MGSDLKQRIIESVKATWNSINSFAAAHKTGAASSEQNPDITMEQEVDDVLMQMSNDDDTATCKSQQMHTKISICWSLPCFWH